MKRCPLLLAALLLCGCGSDEATGQAADRTNGVPTDTANGSTAAERGMADVSHDRAGDPAPPATAGAPAADRPVAGTGAAEPQVDADQPMFAPTPATVMRDTLLMERPSTVASIVTELSQGTAVTLVDRRAGWFAVLHDDTRGWVRLLHVSSQPPGTHGPIPPELERAARVATGREGGGNIAVTTGTRGLNEEQLRAAEADPSELRRLEALGVDRATAEDYAAGHDLQRRTVAYPPEPPRASR